MIGAEIPLLKVEFDHSLQAPLAEYAQVFGTECLFNRGTTRLHFSTRYLRRKIVRSIEDLVVNTTVQSYDPVYTDVEKSWCTLLKTSLCVRLRKMESMPTMEELADEFGVCSQTLRRRLKDEKLTYRELKAQARRDVVMEQICDERVSLAQISLMAGFAETNGLARAMKAWTGFSPSQYRRIATQGEKNEHAGQAARDVHTPQGNA
jgi:AraC-like DNA-binding protein